MSLSVLYRPNSAHERAVLDWQRDFQAVTGYVLELISLETPDGAHLAEVCGIMQYPALLARRENGDLIEAWEGEDWPPISQVSQYGAD